ncbi:MAG: hypothetical protein ACXWDO_07305, partial [Bacteroidia bacterium]
LYHLSFLSQSVWDKYHLTFIFREKNLAILVISNKKNMNYWSMSISKGIMKSFYHLTPRVSTHVFALRYRAGKSFFLKKKKQKFKAVNYYS